MKHKGWGGVLLILVAAAGFTLFWWTLAADEGLQGIDPSQGELFSVVPFLYSWATPPLAALVAAVVVAYVAWGASSPPPLRLFGRRYAVPGLSTALAQIVVAAFDLALAALCLLAFELSQGR